MKWVYPDAPPDKEWIWVAWVTDKATGKRRYPPRGKKAFLILVDRKNRQN